MKRGAPRSSLVKWVVHLSAALVVSGCASGEPTEAFGGAPHPEPLPELEARVVIEGSAGPREVLARVRTTDAERSVGLMYVKTALGDTTGMLFVMEDDSDHGFWMKNTNIPLDMLFIDRAGVVVGVVQNVQPHSTQRRAVGKPSRYVLEVDAGWSTRFGVGPGAKVAMSVHAAPPASPLSASRPSASP